MTVRERIEALRVSGGPDNADLERVLHRYYVACARRIWVLLPQEESRRGVETAERFLAGDATLDDLVAVEYWTELAAFKIDYDRGSDDVAAWIDDLTALSGEELQKLIQTADSQSRKSARELLLRAAYFADFATCFAFIRDKDPSDSYEEFLSQSLFDEHFGDASGDSRRGTRIG